MANTVTSTERFNILFQTLAIKYGWSDGYELAISYPVWPL